MVKLKLLIILLFAAGAAALLVTENAANPHALANSAGPPAGFTRAPGELDCSDCHTTPAQSSGALRLGAPQRYTPGQTYDLTVTHSTADPTRVRWGFQLTALDAADQKAGTFEPSDDLTQILGGQGPFPARQYVEHTQTGTFEGQQSGAAWTFKWIAPAQDVGPVTFYVAGNQANGDFNSSGDNIYFTFASATFQPPAVNSIEDTPFFVAQHYRDFLGREPDESGLQFWTNDIEQCGADAQCREVKRINVSAAFFLSIEFQETGYLVYRLHKAAFGDLPGKPVPVTRSAFLPDTQALGSGVVVGQGDWRAQLESNKNAFALAFVGRAAFRSAHPASLSAGEFVARLDANAGGVLDDAERARLAGAFGGPSASSDDAQRRAQALLAVAESPALQRREFNRAFVLMQYFGYLRRDPDAAPDSDFSGYNFWLGKLNQFGGNFIEAEMVKAFISSAEYRGRFGPR